jgi:hypothetical protein
VDLERLVAAPEGVNIDVGQPGHELKDALSAFEDRRRAGQAGARQRGGEDGVAPGLGVGEPLPVGQRLRSRLAHRDMVVKREADGLGQLVGWQLHQLAGRECDRRQTEACPSRAP